MIRASTVRGCLALLALTLAPPRARLAAAEPGADAITLSVPASVTAGEVVVLRWEGVPPEVEELELVLSLDGGRSYPVRLCPELDGRTRSFAWTVPDLPAEQARLMLRVGGEEGERLGALSRPFRIAHAEGAPRPNLTFHEGTMWTGFRAPAGVPPASLAAGAPSLDKAPAAGPGALPEDGAQAAPPLRLHAPVATPPSTAPRACRLAATAPRDVPLRS